ncbi:MAG TPA: SHOCT domain-containing protein [Syntrophobacteraceae bacterium]|nr:SHOCT domain-containing protein [Syntrophobacteraceae bacterium]
MRANEQFKKKSLLWMAVAALLLFSAKESFAQGSNYPCWGMGPWMMGGAMGWIGGIFMIFFWILVLVALVLFIRWLVGAGANRRVLPGAQLSQGPVESAADILKKRYARGEITREQFESMRRDVE